MIGEEKMFLKGIRYTILFLGVCYFIFILRDIMKHKEEIRKNPFDILLLAAAPVVWFLASLGVSDTVLNTFCFRVRKDVTVRALPGTIFLSAVLPMCLMSYLYIGEVSVDIVTLVVLLVVRMAGYQFGFKVFMGRQADKLRYLMSGIMIVTAFVLFAKLYLLPSEGGNLVGLPPLYLAIAAAAFFLLSALDVIGFASNALLFALLLIMGMSTLSTFPVVMTSSAFGSLMLAKSFVSQGIYNKKIVAIQVCTGWIGVIVAVQCVQNMNFIILQTIVIGLLVYNAFSVFQGEGSRDTKHSKKARTI